MMNSRPTCASTEPFDCSKMPPTDTYVLLAHKLTPWGMFPGTVEWGRGTQTQCAQADHRKMQELDKE